MSLLLWLPCPGCDEPTSAADAGPADGGPSIERCGPGDDADEDAISSMDEGQGDPDGDGRPNALDDDSDGDGFPDAEEAGDADCETPPVDADGDGLADFLDTDANGDGFADEGQLGDLDGDAIPDHRDLDVDGDGIPNVVEHGGGDAPRDSDGDGTPDVHDVDSDGDTIGDIHEGLIDDDLDDIPNSLDLDSDGDGVLDAQEAGDGLVETPPVACPREVDPVTGQPASDGKADYADPDSDNDGLGDGEERDLGTDRCSTDTDGDGVDDLAEGAYERLNCPDGDSGVDCGCATSAACTIPEEHFYVVLPHGGAAVERDLTFATDIRIADVFFLTDSTGSMGTVLERVQKTVSTPETGLIARIGESIPDAWFGGGHFRDFPFGGHGGLGDEAFGLAIRMSPASDAAMVASAFEAVEAGGGGDRPESHTEALFQVLTGVGGLWTHPDRTYGMDRYVGSCLEDRWGAPCFRPSALPIVVTFTDVCAHEAPPGDSVGCASYTDVTPPPADWATMIAEMNHRGAKFVGIATNDGSTCASPDSGPNGTEPCYFLRETARATHSVDLDDNLLVYDLPAGGATDTAFIDTVVGALETIATRVPLDVDTSLRDDPTDPAAVDARRFIQGRKPSCRAVDPPVDTCWSAPAGVAHADAVAAVDDSTFFSVVPGARVSFRITFRNDFVPGGRSAQVFFAFIDVRSGTAVLDTRQVLVVVPASPRGPLE